MNNNEWQGLRLNEKISVRVPASSANIGPGFDSFAVALGLYDDITVEAFETQENAAVEMNITGEGAGTLSIGEDNLIVRSLRAGLTHAGVKQPSLKIWCHNTIAQGRGLGSSAAAIIAGLVAAQGLVGEQRLSLDKIFALATDIEGHPDNVAASLYGGFTVAWAQLTADNASAGHQDSHSQPVDAPELNDSDIPTIENSDQPESGVVKGETSPAEGNADAGAAEQAPADEAPNTDDVPSESKPRPLAAGEIAMLLGDSDGCAVLGGDQRAHPGAVTMQVHPDIRLIVCISQEELPTGQAREMLPTTLSYKDAAFNIGRAGLLVHAITQCPKLLLPATGDRMHQDVRAQVVPACAELLHTLRGNGIPAVVSGAGPSILVLGDREIAIHVSGLVRAGRHANSWRVQELPVAGGAMLT